MILLLIRVLRRIAKLTVMQSSRVIRDYRELNEIRLNSTNYSRLVRGQSARLHVQVRNMLRRNIPLTLCFPRGKLGAAHRRENFVSQLRMHPRCASSGNIERRNESAGEQRGILTRDCGITIGSARMKQRDKNYRTRNHPVWIQDAPSWMELNCRLILESEICFVGRMLSSSQKSRKICEEFVNSL